MKKAITLLAAILCSVFSYAQTNPYVGNPGISPTPLSDFTPIAVFSFDVGNSGLSPVTYASGDAVVLTITLLGGIPQNSATPVSSLGGSWLSYFDWTYNSTNKTYTGTQNKDIPAATNSTTPVSGTITVNYYRTMSSSPGAPGNGFSVDLTPNSAAGNSPGDDHTERLTYVNALPVTLVRFDGKADGCKVNLSWETAVEKDFDHFDIQYSRDGSGFNTIGSMRSKNNPVGSQYSYATEQPAGTGMYRLYMVDKDGSYAISNTATVRTQCSDNKVTWLVYPQPAETGNVLHLQVIAATGSKMHVAVTNIQGQRLVERGLDVQAGDNRFTLPAANWPAGTYLVSITDGQQFTETQKIIVR